MKHSIIILLFLLSIEWTYAKCASGGFKFYPQQRHISMNSLFIVEGYGNNQKQILEFHKTKLYLLSEHGELIELAPQNIQKGQMLLMQAVFKPCTTLQPNTKYFLKNPDNASGFFTQWNPDTKNLEKVHWITGDSAVCALLATGLKIEFEKTKVNYYGCGPAANAIFNIKTTSDTEIWYKTEVVNMTNNRTTTYFLTAMNSELQVGHGMCAGAFTFDDTSSYKVRFTPISIDGATLNTTDWIRFHSPYLNAE